MTRTLVRKLKSSGVRLEAPDRDTVLFRNVPLASNGLWNKQSTNLLCKKAGIDAAYLTFVDEDLAYRGPDSGLVKAFSTGPTQSGWRALVLGNARQPQADQAVENGLAALGFPDGQPRLRVSDTSRCEESSGGEARSSLDAFAEDITEVVAQDEQMEPTVRRTSETEAMVSCLLRWSQARLPLVVGASGVGKSNLLYSAARLLRRARPKMVVLRLDAAEVLSGTLFDADREKILDLVLKDAARRGQVVLAIERLDRIATEVAHGRELLCDALDRGVLIAGTTIPNHVPRFRASPLWRRIQPVILKDTSPRETVEILERLRNQIGAHHGLEITTASVKLCLKMALELPGHLPAKGITLLDESASNASLLGGKTVSPDDIHAAFSRCSKPQERAAE